MKLNKRVSILVLPVLFVSFLLVAIGLYIVERSSIYSLEQSAAALESTELTGIFSKYDLLAKGFLASLVQSDAFIRFLNSEDIRFKFLALSSGLDGILSSLSNLSSDHFAIAFVRGSGELEYYFENDHDPFSQPDPEQMGWVKMLLEKEVHSESKYFQDESYLAHCRILDSFTLNPPVDYGSSSTLAILVLMRPTEFESRITELTTLGRFITFWEKSLALPPTKKLEARKMIPGFGTIGVQISSASVDKRLGDIVFRLVAGFLLITFLTSFTLQWLIRRYVTGPIKKLEKQLANIDLTKNEKIEIFESNDEIGNLSRSFANLYSQLKDVFQETKQLAERDSLTSLYNRRIFGVILEKLLSRASRKDGKVALFYIDIDNFKYVNDTFGHTAGDTLLRTFGRRLHDVTRGGDFIFKNKEIGATAARLAGDEFAVVVHNYIDTNAPGKIANRILSLCEDGFTVEGEVYPISLSIGVATYPTDGTTAEALIINADAAMYSSKKGGKNRVSFGNPDIEK